MDDYTDMQEAEIDWERLRDLRDSFLAGSAGGRDYWQDEDLLADYDATFGRRIAWKWQWVLADLKNLGWVPPEGGVLDWGCGPGVAAREFAAAFANREFHLADRSALAMRYAAVRLREEQPKVTISQSSAPAPTVFLVSHVLSELNDETLAQLLRKMQDAQSIVWVEPGTYEQARILGRCRQKLLDAGFRVVAPCVHQGPCGLFAPENSRDWCHHFAPPPREIFQDGFWTHFGKAMGVDLRSLPLSYLVMDRRPSTVEPLPDSVRILGHIRMVKPYAVLQGCAKDGIWAQKLTKRRHPELYRKLRHREPLSLCRWQKEGQEISSLEDLSGKHE